MALSLLRYTWPNDTSRLTPLLKLRLKKDKDKSVLIALDKIDYLPEILIIEILSWLSVKDLLQFKTVCKSWHAIISSPDFVSKHLNNYYNNNDDWRSCLLAQCYVTQAEIQLFQLLLDETPQVLADEVLYGMPLYCSYVYGPCDGLYYVFKYDSSWRALWNPALNELRMLPDIICKPHLPPEFHYADNEVYGFGFDHVSRDYKVVVMKCYWTVDLDSDLKHPVSVLVYSLMTDSWRYCGDLADAYDLEINKCYIYVKGCCYWFGSLENRSLIISFDMADDSFKEIDAPDYARAGSNCLTTRLAVYDDSLAFMSLNQTEINFDMWTWTDGCWTKKFSLGPLPNVWSLIGHWKGNKLLLQGSGHSGYGGRSGLLLFDPETQETKALAFQTQISCEGVFAYMESLVSIKNKNEEGQQPKEDEEGQQPKEY